MTISYILEVVQFIYPNVMFYFSFAYNSIFYNKLQSYTVACTAASNKTSRAALISQANKIRQIEGNKSEGSENVYGCSLIPKV